MNLIVLLRLMIYYLGLFHLFRLRKIDYLISLSIEVDSWFIQKKLDLYQFESLVILFKVGISIKLQNLFMVLYRSTSIPLWCLLIHLFYLHILRRVCLNEDTLLVFLILKDLLSMLIFVFIHSTFKCDFVLFQLFAHWFVFVNINSL
jgi:hypothetical protein